MGMKIYINMLIGKVFALDVEPDNMVEQVKKMIEVEEGIPPEQQRLIFPEDRCSLKMEGHWLVITLKKPVLFTSYYIYSDADSHSWCHWGFGVLGLSLIHICRCRRIERCRSRWSPYH
eukprot:TRINITY_DN2558_c0_g2_i2.p1 TRINITY_DN2558_c0_g2~~TRINITY_DN2558_c0_g2_i2.p1  ORF type:complete len:118 (-),score=14.49 TRINITY_DN2558_c0_g2_i2:15-368(-)